MSASRRTLVPRRLRRDEAPEAAATDSANGEVEGTHGSAFRRGSLELVGVSKRFSEVVAVRDVTISVPPGDFLTILGPSGSGKTTTLNMIGGFEPPTSGEIFIDDRPCTKLPAAKRNLGIVFQDYALFPHMTVAANIAYPLRLRRRPKREIAERVEEILGLVRLAGYGARYPSQLSGGQQQRVALARALVFRPPVLLMDEPLGSLDKKLRDEMELEIRRLHRELGITVISVTHDQEEALTMSDRIAIMHDGRVAQLGTPEDVYERPANRFVAAFIGESNFLPATVEECGPKAYVARDATGARFVGHGGAGGGADLVQGGSVALAVRPERTSFVDPSCAAPENVTEGQLDEVIYVGEKVRCRVRLDVGPVMSVTVSGGARSTVPECGSRVRIGWRAEDCIFLSDAERAESRA